MDSIAGAPQAPCYSPPVARRAAAAGLFSLPMGLVSRLGSGPLGPVLLALEVYSWLVIVRALVSWLRPDPRQPLVRLLARATEPLLAPLRRLVPPHRLHGLDLSPVLLLVLIQLAGLGLIHLFAPRPPLP